MIRPVAITGLGTVGSFGLGRAALEAALDAPPREAAPVDRSAGYHLPHGARTAWLVDPAGLRDFLPPAAARRMSPPSKFALTAARLALRDSGLHDDRPGTDRTGVILGTAFGPTSFTERLLREMIVSGPESASPALFTECVANAPASQIAIAIGARGPNLAITEREASGLLAVGHAFGLVARGVCDWALAGVVDEMTPLLHAILDRFRSLARAGEDGVERARPFDRRRRGFVAAEGSTVAVLEPLDRAQARGAPILALVRGAGSAFDPSATAAGWGGGAERVARRIRRALERAGWRHQEVDQIVSGASGARGGDRHEAAILRELWPRRDARPEVRAPKGALGEYGGGHLAAALALLRGGPATATIGFENEDPALGIAPAPARGARQIARSLVCCTAAGGAAAWLLLERGSA